MDIIAQRHRGDGRGRHLDGRGEGGATRIRCLVIFCAGKAGSKVRRQGGNIRHYIDLKRNKKMELDRLVMPGTEIQSKIMQPTAGFKHSILKAWFPIP